MRLSEKTLEVSITSQITHRLNIANAIWFGLTQKQEKTLGFDVAGSVAGKLVILQFKASSLIVHPKRYSNPRRKFSVPHNQLANLQVLSNAFPDSVYYVFPHIGTTEEVALNPDLAAQTWLLNVADLPDPFPSATNASNTHYAFIEPPEYDLRSEPVQGKLLGVDTYTKLLNAPRHNSREMVAWIQQKRFSFSGMKAYGLLMPS